MKRDVNFNEISDGKMYKRDDLVKVSCNECKSCSECCKVTDDTILLDPYDIALLGLNLKKTFEELLGEEIDLRVVDGVITPYLKKNADHSCIFLNSFERCSIHAFRPGFCRLFPLGRIYEEDGSFSYFIQVHECPYPNKTKIKVKNWLGIANLPKYEAYIERWHSITKNLSECALENPELSKTANMKLLNTFFVTPYSSVDGFFDEFEKRVTQYEGI